MNLYFLSLILQTDFKSASRSASIKKYKFFCQVLPPTVEKQKSVEEEEKPAWVKDALSKKRKVPVMPAKGNNVEATN